MQKIDTQPKAFEDCAREGRASFRSHGVTGIFKHNYARHSSQHAGFVSGFNHARLCAAESAQDEAFAYHAQTVREAATDRAWAEKLSSNAAR